MREGDPLGEVFPTDDKLAPFIVAMSMARNDIEHALYATETAAKNDAPALTYFVRLATGHLFEAIQALDCWCQDSDIAGFLRRLPEPGAGALRAVNRTRQQIGHEALDHARNHYACPDSSYDSSETLREVMDALSEKPVNLEIDRNERRVRLVFADEVAIALALWKHNHTHPDAFGGQLRHTRTAAAAFTILIDVSVVAYFRAIGVDI